MQKETKYTPGVCNIGREEINKRKALTGVAAIATLLFTYFSITHESAWMKTFLFLSATLFFVNLLEVQKRFCVSFGARGLYNFGKLGKTQRVTDRRALLKDRKHSLILVLIGILGGLAFTLLINVCSGFLTKPLTANLSFIL